MQLQEIESLLNEMYQMLQKICTHIDKVNSNDYKQQEDIRAFNINVAADMYVETLSKLRK